ncbi:MAG: ATP-binding cassette domain-containing protein [Oligoflexales bacterium]
MIKLNLFCIEKKNWLPLTKTSVFFVCMVPFLLYFSSTVALLFRADAIDLITNKSGDVQKLGLHFLSYFSFMVLNVLLNTLFDRFSEREVQITISKWIKLALPSGFMSDMSIESPTIFYQNMVSRLSEIKAAYFRIIYKFFTFVASLVFFGFVVWKEGYYKPLIISPIIFFMVMLSEQILKKEFRSRCREDLKSADRFTEWLKSVFSSWAMISRVWAPDLIRKWSYLHVDEKLYHMKRLLKTSTARDTIQSLFLNSSTIALAIFFLYEAYCDSITVGMALSWLPLCNYINEGAFNILDCVKSLTEKRIKEEHLQGYLRGVYDRQFTVQHDTSRLTSFEKIPWSVNVSLPGIQLIANSNPGIYCVRGTNGSGKSTLLRYLSGMPIDPLLREKLDRYVSMSGFDSKFTCLLPQDLAQVYPLKSLGQHLYGPECQLLNEYLIAECKSRFAEWQFSKNLVARWIFVLRRIDKLFDERSKLSGGESRLVQIARILISRSPENTILVLDEPELSLDEENRKLVFETIKTIGQKFPLIMVTHTIQNLD